MGNQSKKLTGIQKRRKLEALYARGELVRFGPKGVLKPDEELTDEDVSVWVTPPSPLQREMAIRDASADRNRAVLDARRDEKSSGALNARAYITNMDDAELLEFLLDLDESDRMAKARREVLLQKEWEDFNTLRDQMRLFEEAGSPDDDPKWASLLERDRDFGDAVDKEFKRIREGDLEGLQLIPRDVQERRAFEKRVDQAASTVFMQSYESLMLWYACRDDEDHSVQFFDTTTEMRSMPLEVQEILNDTLQRYITEAAEAKNSRTAGAGSTSSEPVSEPETSSASTPEESTE